MILAPDQLSLSDIQAGDLITAKDDFVSGFGPFLVIDVVGDVKVVDDGEVKKQSVCLLLIDLSREESASEPYESVILDKDLLNVSVHRNDKLWTEGRHDVG